MIYVILAYVTYPFIFLAAKLFPHRGAYSILVFQTAKIGDMICTTPVFREIKKAHPEARLGVVIDPSTSDIVRHNPHIDEIFEISARDTKGISAKLALAFAIFTKRYSAAVILSPNATNILAAFWAMIPVRVAILPDYAGGTLKSLLALNTHVEGHVHGRMTMETFLLSLRHLGITAKKRDKEVYSPPGVDFPSYFKGGEPYVGLILGTGNPIKEWGRDNFLRLTRLILSNTNATVLLFGSDKERADAEAIMAGASADGAGSAVYDRRVRNLCGEFSLAEMPLIIKKTAAVVGVDTGLIYMADAEKVPLIDISGPSDISDQRPTGERAIIMQKKLDCCPCSHTFKTPYECIKGHRKCLLDIKPEDVFTRLAGLLKVC